MILFVQYLQQQLQRHQKLQQLLVIAILLQLSPLQRNLDVSAQWITVAEFSMRVPGRCTFGSGTNGNSSSWRRDQFDCGGSLLLPQQQSRCIPLRHFHDGIADCPDGSDEFCFPGYVKCGEYCVSLQHAAQCFINPRCDNSPTSPQFCDVTKKKLCSVEGTVPCKGYGECVMRKWIEKGETNCIDKSDQDLAYIAVFGIKRDTGAYPVRHGFGILNPFHGATGTQKSALPRLQSVSPSPSAGISTEYASNSSDWDITKDWSDATMQPAVTKFIFQMPKNDFYRQDFKSSSSGVTTVGLTLKMEKIASSVQVNHQPQRNTQSPIINTESSPSGANTVTSQFHLITLEPQRNDIFTIHSAISSLIYRPGMNLTEQIQAQPKSPDSNSYETVNNDKYEKLLPLNKPSHAIQTDSGSSNKEDRSSANLQQANSRNEAVDGNPSVPDNGNVGVTSDTSANSNVDDSQQKKEQQNQQHPPIPSGTTNTSFGHEGALKQGNIIAPNGISTSSSLYNQRGTFSPPAREISDRNNSENTTPLVLNEAQHVPPLNQRSEQHSTNVPQNDNLTSAITSTTTGPSPDQMACARYEYEEAQRLVPEPSCTCPPGQMPSGEHAACKTTIVSTFGIDVHDMCGGMQTDPVERPRLAILVLNRTQLHYQACVRRDGHPVMVQLDCSQCTAAEFLEGFKQNSNDHYVPLRIMELSVGACLSSTLNDCDAEHADCLVDGPRYQCRCHEGWNDTSKEIGKTEGRRCEQLILLANECILFLGYCLLWWLLLLAAFLFLVLPLLFWLGYQLYKCFQRRNRRNVVEEEEGHLVISEAGSVRDGNPNVANAESLHMHDNPNWNDSSSTTADEDDKKVVSNIDAKSTSDSISGNNQNTKVTEKVLVKQQTVRSLNTWHKNDEGATNEKQQLRMQSEAEQTFDGSKSEKNNSAPELIVTPTNYISSSSSVVSSQKKVKKTASEALTESSDVSLESQKSINMAVAKDAEILLESNKVIKSLENIESTSPKIMKVSQSPSETSLRTMWELFKHNKWEQPPRPSSIKSSTPSLDRLIDVFLCRKINKRIHPDTITTCNSSDFPLNTVKVVDVAIDTIPNLLSTALTTVTTSNSIATTTTITAKTTTTTANDTPLLQVQCAIDPVNGMAQLFTSEAPMKMQVLEQKIVTETKTLTTTSAIPVLPGEIPLSIKVQPPEPIIHATAVLNRLESVKTDEQTVLDMASITADKITQAHESTEQQSSVTEQDTVTDQELSAAVQTGNSSQDQTDSKLSTTTVVTSSDTQLKRWATTIHPSSNVLRKTQSEHGLRLMVPQQNTSEKTPPTADELREALKEVASMKPPTKRLTERQKEKLSASCGHLPIEGDDETDKKGGSIGQLLAASRPHPRSEHQRKLSSISEKSIEMINAGGQLISAPSSVSCPTTTRISKDCKRLPRTLQRYRDGTYGIWNHFFAELMTPLAEEPTNVNGHAELISDSLTKSNRGVDGYVTAFGGDFNKVNDGWRKMGHSSSVRRKVDNDKKSCRQRPISTVDARPPWDFSPLKDGELDRIAPLQSAPPRYHQPRKWISALQLDNAREMPSCSNKSIHRRRQSDVLHKDTLPGSYSARLHTRLPYAEVLRNSSGVKWTPNGTQDNSRPIKEQLWWGVH